MAGASIKFIITSFLISCCVSGNVGQTASKPVSQLCLGCICAAISGCSTNICKDGHCGIFTISRPFWVDAGMPTIEGKSPNDPDAYESCSLDDYCSQDTMQGYMVKYKKDCDGDGRITCYDYFSIHQRGGIQCRGPLLESRMKIFNECLIATEQIQI